MIGHIQVQWGGRTITAIVTADAVQSVAESNIVETIGKRQRKMKVR